MLNTVISAPYQGEYTHLSFLKYKTFREKGNKPEERLKEQRLTFFLTCIIF